MIRASGVKQKRGHQAETGSGQIFMIRASGGRHACPLPLKFPLHCHPASLPIGLSEDRNLRPVNAALDFFAGS